MPEPPDLHGIFPPITTPFDDRGDIDLAALERNLARYETVGLAGYVAFGSNGEAVHLDLAERQAVLETVRRATQKPVVAGINAFSTRAALAQIEAAAAAGADAALVITPYFYKGAMTQAVLSAFFREVAAASPLPILIYNVPQNTGVTIRPATIAALGAVEGIVGVKDSSGDLAALRETVDLAGDDFHVLVGNAGICHPALEAGAVGAILAVACVAPAACVALYDAVRAGDRATAESLQKRLAPLGRLVTVEHGIGGLKAALDVAGFIGGAPRAPLPALAEDARRGLCEVLTASGLLSPLGR